MASSNLTEKIENLWNWFEANLPLIESVISETNHPKTQVVVEQLDQYVLDLGKFKWLLDNPTSNHFTFTISPNNNADLLAISRAAIADAPYLSHWSFFDSIPAKGFHPIEIYDDQMDIQFVDPKNWKAYLRKQPNHQFELLVKVNEVQNLDPETQEVAVEIIVTNLIGEAARINQISTIKIVESLDDSLAFNLSQLQNKL